MIGAKPALVETISRTLASNTPPAPLGTTSPKVFIRPRIWLESLVEKAAVPRWWKNGLKTLAANLNRAKSMIARMVDRKDRVLYRMLWPVD